MDVDFGILKLDGNQAKVYQTLLVSGQLSKAELATACSITYEEMDTILEILKQKTLARSIPGMADRYAVLLPLGTTKEELEAASNDLAVLGREIENTAATQMTNLKEQLQQATATFNSNTQAELQDLEQQISSLESTIASQKTTQDEKVITTLQVQREGIEQTISHQHTVVNSEVNRLKATGTSRIASKTEGVTQSAANAKEKHTAINEQALEGVIPLDLTPVEEIQRETKTGITDIISEVSTTATELNKSSIDAVQMAAESHSQLATTLENTATTLVSEINTGLRSSGSQLDEAIRMRVQQYDRMQEEWTTNLGAQKDVIAGTSGEIEGHYEGSLATLNSAATAMTELAGELDGSLNSDIGLLSAKSVEFMDEASNEFKGHLATSHQEITTLLTDEITTIKSNLQQQVDGFMSETSRQLQSLVTNFGTQLEGKRTNMDQLRGELKVSKISGINEQMDITMVNVKNSVEQTHSAYKSRIEEHGAGLQESQTTLTSKLGLSVSDLERMGLETTTLVQGSKKRLEDWNLKVQDQIKDQTATLDGKLTSDLKEQLTAMNTTMQEQVAALQASANQSLTTIQTQLSELSTSSTHKLDSTLQSMQQTMQTISGGIRSRLDTALQQATTSYHGLVDDQTSLSQDLIIQLKGDVDSIEQAMLSSMQASLTEFQTKITAGISAIENEVQTTVNGAFEAISQQVSGAKQIGVSVLGSIESLGSSAADAQLGAVQQTFDSYTQKYSQSTSAVSNKVNTLTTLLSSFFKMQEDTATPSIMTTHVVGKQAIIRYMTDMISRVKSKMTILAPNISMIDDEKILALPRTSQITIVSHIDENDHKDWIEKMHGATANVQLRTLQEQGFGAALPDFIGCEREGEEIIIGTLDEGNQDYVAIASNSENFVKIFGSQVISEYSRGRSKQLQK